ncbi:hypothetical protein JTB14_015148 [Gonioctena quinquepunctata]|nr:hypothetical protein JTB14_015148 [Gonioctena quinquepunctata]
MVNPTVKICDGELQGCERVDLDGKSFLAFLGIPYAKPPVGELRFKAPQPAESWLGVRDATKEGECCIQKDMGITEGSEDCLNLNVYTRELQKGHSLLKPVMVWIHGGGFLAGSNKLNFACPDFLITEDIVLVAINYRLGFLGFLSLQDPSLGIPGNAALKDQTLALKWVQKNIKSFGGDPNNVTIFGESAGAASVHYHVLSRSSKGLFHKAIMQSGCTLNPWALRKQRPLDFVRFMGKEVDTEKEALEILENLKAEEIVENQSKYVDGRLEIISPVVEKPNNTDFITQHPIELIMTGNYNKVPVLLGYCSDEGLMFDGSGTVCRFSTEGIQGEKPDLENFIQSYVKLEKGSKTSKAACGKLSDFYFQGKNATRKHLFATDYHFLVGIIGCAIWHAKTSPNPVYFYRFSLDAGLNVIKIMMKINDTGACHGDELGYLFKFTGDGMEMGETEKTAVRRCVKLWTNFAKFGNPTPKEDDLLIQWKPIDKNNFHFLDIDKELTLQVDPASDRIALWRDSPTKPVYQTVSVIFHNFF